ncbi:MAG: replicative DNA helicase [Alphaproteobacteria bacterium]|nr:replicative DNA helicase [Alphaproteobacteria bacterium]MDD9920141.1 replicative DNA helicase [Alphaproteobacteria bacterium]
MVEGQTAEITELQTAPPHSVEAEQAMLGAILYDNQRLDDLQGRVQPDHFYVPFHADVFRTMERIINKGFEASPLTLREQMKQSDYASEVDLFQHLTQMLENAQYNQDVMALSEIIITHFLQRQLMVIGGDMQRKAATAVDNEGTHETLEKASTELFTLAETGSSNTTIQTLGNPLKIVIERAEAAKHQNGITGVSSGFMDLDDKLGGFHNSDLVILAARPSMGKTAMALNLAYNACQKAQTPVGVFSLEMSADQLAARFLCSAANIDSNKLMNGQLQEDEFGRIVAASNMLADLPLYVDDTPGLSITALRARARRMKRQYNIGMLLVDYLQLLHGSSRSSSENRVQEISEISMGLKSIARELNVPVIALSQLSRAVENRENKRPQLSDLRESGSIEQDADVVLFLFREDYYLEKQLGAVEVGTGEDTMVENASDGDKDMIRIQERLKHVRGKAEVLISKNRKGATGAIALSFHGPTTTFHNYAPPGQY